ncbi:hypothetical protein [Streptomyces sp. CA-251251]|uniref:hypothetical protein n=1 Tax=Streptomyces sp. CA-251251 TaxID=3240063 RepID=UPI003D8E1A1A
MSMSSRVVTQAALGVASLIPGAGVVTAMANRTLRHKDWTGFGPSRGPVPSVAVAEATRPV